MQYFLCLASLLGLLHTFTKCIGLRVGICCQFPFVRRFASVTIPHHRAGSQEAEASNPGFSTPRFTPDSGSLPHARTLAGVVVSLRFLRNSRLRTRASRL